MSDPGTGGPPQPPPPGWQPPPPPAPSYTGSYAASQPPPPGYPPPPPTPGAWAPAPGMLGAAHKPGAMPLRPLGLGDMYDAAFRVIRFNPKATVGSAVLVATIAWLVPVIVTALLSFTLDFSLDATDSPSDEELVGLFGSIGSIGVGLVLVAFGTILVTGMIAHVTAAAAVGRRLTLGEAWAATHGKRWRLIGLALLLGLSTLLLMGAYVLLWVVVVVASGDNVLPVVLWGLVSVPAFICVMVWFWVRVYYLPVPALMLEPVGIFGALSRGFTLTRQQFWRTFGIARADPVGGQRREHLPGLPDRHHRTDRERRGRRPVRPAGAGGDPGAEPGRRGRVRHSVHLRRHLAAVPRPAHAQGGLRRRADAAGRDHGLVTPPLVALVALVGRLPDPPLDPSGSEARSKLRRELLHPEYHQQNLIQEVFSWLMRKVGSGLDRASEAPPLSTFMAMLVFVALALGLAWLVSRARHTAREKDEKRAVLTDEVVTADELRARAEAAMEAGRFEEAVVEGFRAVAVRQVERGRLSDTPGATAHEVAEALAREHVAMADRVHGSARLFDEVLYGDRPATREQAGSVLALDDDLVVRR